jgi:hypothetical protein
MHSQRWRAGLVYSAPTALEKTNCGFATKPHVSPERRGLVVVRSPGAAWQALHFRRGLEGYVGADGYF